MYIEFRIWRIRFQVALGMLEKSQPEPEQTEVEAETRIGFQPNDE